MRIEDVEAIEVVISQSGYIRYRQGVAWQTSEMLVPSPTQALHEYENGCKEFTLINMVNGYHSIQRRMLDAEACYFNGHLSDAGSDLRWICTDEES